jgi:hypothetical protein
MYGISKGELAKELNWKILYETTRLFKIH